MDKFIGIFNNGEHRYYENSQTAYDAGAEVVCRRFEREGISKDELVTNGETDGTVEIGQWRIRLGEKRKTNYGASNLIVIDSTGEVYEISSSHRIKQTVSGDYVDHSIAYCVRMFFKMLPFNTVKEFKLQMEIVRLEDEVKQLRDQLSKI